MGRLRSILGVASLLAVPSAEAVTIEHAAVGCIVAERFPTIAARFDPAGEVGRARVYFRAAGTIHWYFVEMQGAAGAFSGLLPKPKRSLKAIDYYVEAVDRASAPSRTPDYHPPVVAVEAECRHETLVALAVTVGRVVLGSAAGAPSIPAGFATDGIVAMSGVTGAGGGASGGTGGGVSTTAIAAGVVAAGAAVAGIAAAGGGDGDTGGPTTTTPTTVGAGPVTTAPGTPTAPVSPTPPPAGAAQIRVSFSGAPFTAQLQGETFTVELGPGQTMTFVRSLALGSYELTGQLRGGAGVVGLGDGGGQPSGPGIDAASVTLDGAPAGCVNPLNTPSPPRAFRIGFVVVASGNTCR
jgi:hypothetical protein